MDPRVILRHIIIRLEPEFGKVSLDMAETPGVLHLVNALKFARSALASGDECAIAKAALDLPPLERTGRRIATAYAAAKRGKAGGDVTGPRQHEKAAKAMAPWIKRFHELMERGNEQQTAREIKEREQKVRARVKREMVKEGFPVPSDPTLRKWLK